MARIPDSHPGYPGSTPGQGIKILLHTTTCCCIAEINRTVEKKFFFLRNCWTIFQSNFPFYIPTTKDERSIFSTSLPAFGTICILYFRHLDRCIIILLVVVQLLSCVMLCDHMDCSKPGSSVLHCLLEFAHIHIHRVGGAIYPSNNIASWSLFAFPKRQVVLNIFWCAYLPFTYLFQWSISSCFCTFSICIVYCFMLRFEGSVYILDMSPLSDIWFAGIFSHSVCCLSFHPLNKDFHRAKVLNFDEVQFTTFSFYGWCSWSHI